ncbi:MAG: hypothetical protein J6Y02_03140, partial [Pseudobutyrivibrio sp.]|nr:hypothetical protein [Pseudobutyrivibrio sp.]
TKLAEFKWYPADYAVEWFWDDYHMNQHGSYRFSMQLKADYPQLWGETNPSATQMLAINEDINIEKEPAELFKWMDEKDYTVVMYSELDDFEGYHNGFMRFNNQELKKATDSSYFVDIKGGHNVSVKDGTVEIDGNVYEWGEYNTGDVNFLIIDNTNKIIVRTCSTDFNNDEGRFERFEL